MSVVPLYPVILRHSGPLLLHLLTSAHCESGDTYPESYITKYTSIRSTKQSPLWTSGADVRILHHPDQREALAPYTLQPTPHTSHSTPYTLHSTPYTLHPTPYTLHPTPCTPHPAPYTLYPTPYTTHPSPYTLHPTPYLFPEVNQHSPPATRSGPSTPVSRKVISPANYMNFIQFSVEIVILETGIVLK